jgi:nicotinamidase/pyrazinamidase
MDIFWDVDTQIDFMNKEGKLYVPGAESIKPNLAAVTAFARERKIRIWGSVDYHKPDDPEISDNPDFLKTFPPHCLAGTAGAEKIEETKPLNPLWIDGEELSTAEVEGLAAAADRELIFRKQRFDVYSNVNAEKFLKAASPERIFLYGVALDVCVAHALNGMLARNIGRELFLITDAVKAISPEAGMKMEKEWEGRGVRLIKTDELRSFFS